ncbi:hypothetical protein IMZ48_30880 [Candidatus Bathyarchaeota archaeon]|nr:hypothetical protein [Candidatus Bathyarchaeota archaeon]
MPDKAKKYNPSNLKAGGSRRAGIFTYRIEPTYEQYFDYKHVVVGKCWCVQEFAHIDCHMLGRGWAYGDDGVGLGDNAARGGCQTVC